MDVQVVGISGSPVAGSNTDWAIKKILKHTGLDWQFFKLSDFSIQPCNACVGCGEGRPCIVRDDAHDLARIFNQAKAFVLGGYAPFSSLDCRTKAFMERMFCLRKHDGQSQGKIGVSVITTARPPEGMDLPPGAELASRQIDYWMAEEGMVNLGSMVLVGNVGSLRSGHGDDCSMSGVRMIYAPNTAIGLHHIEHDPKFDQVTRELGEKLRQAVLDMGAVTHEHREAI